GRARGGEERRSHGAERAGRELAALASVEPHQAQAAAVEHDPQLHRPDRLGVAASILEEQPPGRAIPGEAAVADEMPDVEAFTQQLLELLRGQMRLDGDLDMLP